jgi:hypothetical protein
MAPKGRNKRRSTPPDIPAPFGPNRRQTTRPVTECYKEHLAERDLILSVAAADFEQDTAEPEPVM